MKPTGIHLTLKFLGDAPVEQRDALQDALDRAVDGHAPFDLAAGGMGCFPNLKRPRVVWSGIHQNLTALQALRDGVETQISPLGYPTDDRPFSPHLTLGRVNRNASRAQVQQVGEVVGQTPADARWRWTVARVALIRSELKPGGAVYITLHHADLR